MATFTSPNNAVLALSPPRVLGATMPVIGAHIGIALVIYDLVLDGLGAYVEVDPALAGTVDPGDIIELWLKGELAFLDSKPIANPNIIITLRIPKGRLHHDKINELHYTIRRGSQNIGTSTPLLTALYNRIRPGLKDTKPDEDGHSELKLKLSDEIKNGVDKDFVSAQVCVTYPYCRAYDTITLKCNGEIMTYKVSPNEAPPPPDPGSAIPTTVCFIVDRPFLESAVRPSNQFDFSYTVTDQYGNTPDTDAVWSATQTVDEDLAGNRLPAAILRENQNDPGDDPAIIDLEKLSNMPLLLIILTAHTLFQPGDTITATYIAKVEGKPDVVVVVSGIVEVDEFGQKKPCILQVPNNQVIAGSTVTVNYELHRNSTLVGQSVTARATVVGQAVPDEKPVITRAEDSKGNIIANPGSTTDSTVKLIGTAAKNQQVQVFDNNISKGTPPVNASGGWELLLSQLNMTRHTFKALALYGTGQSSDTHSVDIMGLEDWRFETVGRVFLPSIPSTVSSGLIVTNLGGTNLQTQIIAAAPINKWLVMWGKCRFSWGTQDMVKVTIEITSASEITVTFLDANENPIGVVVDSPSVEFSAPPGSSIRSFTVDLLREIDRGGYVTKITWSSFR